MPKGLVTGVQLETVLRQLSKVKGFYRFDELPIPFRAVATDLVTGKAVVFSEGELANVMRASMSVPGAVAPAEFDGMMLVDGMLTSNLPVETARAMGADIIIAVNVGTPLLKREQLNGDPRRDRADAEHPDRAERPGFARLAETHRHPHHAGAGRILDRQTSTTCRRSLRSASRRRARWPNGSQRSPSRPRSMPRCASAKWST